MPRRGVILITAVVIATAIITILNLNSGTASIGRDSPYNSVLIDAGIFEKPPKGWICDSKNLLLAMPWQKHFHICKRIADVGTVTPDTEVVEDIAMDGKAVLNGPEKDQWKERPGPIWVKLAKFESLAKTVTEVKTLFGEDATYPIPGWSFAEGAARPHDIESPIEPRIVFRKGNKILHDKVRLTARLDGSFKILQIADLHMVAGYGRCDFPAHKSIADCIATVETTQLVTKTLELEKPDFIVFTGDQIFGHDALDAETALLKALAPAIEHKIPYAVTFGNHDCEGNLNNTGLMEIIHELPYSLSVHGPNDISGVGNYVLTVDNGDNTVSRMYFLDSHSSTTWLGGNYEPIKEDQLQWVSSQRGHPTDRARLAFFHIPLPEYKIDTKPEFGRRAEPVMSPKHNTGALEVLRKLGVQLISVGHDHCNEFCQYDTGTSGQLSPMWLCYGGSGGYNAYGGYPDESGQLYERRFRILEIDHEGSISSWKRVESVDAEVGRMTLVKKGVAKLPSLNKS